MELLEKRRIKMFPKYICGLLAMLIHCIDWAIVISRGKKKTKITDMFSLQIQKKAGIYSIILVHFVKVLKFCI